MMTIRTVSLVLCLSALLALVHERSAFAEPMEVDLILVPPQEGANILDSFIVGAAPAPLGTRQDTEQTTVTGDVLAEIDIAFGPDHEAAATAITFLGGRLSLEDATYELSYGFWGRVTAATVALAGVPQTPSPPGAVSAGVFDTGEHELVLNEGAAAISTTGLISGVVPELSIDLAEEPIVATMEGQGQLEVLFDGIRDQRAYYRVRAILDVAVDEVAYEEPDLGVQVRLGLSGTVVGEGWFSRCVAPLCADLAGGDGCVNTTDLDAFANQWLMSGDPADCPLTADLARGECAITLADLAAFESAWLEGCP